MANQEFTQTHSHRAWDGHLKLDVVDVEAVGTNPLVSFEREIVRRPQAVAIVPIRHRTITVPRSEIHPTGFSILTEVLLLQQYRPAINDWITEIPAGQVDQGETLEQAANRELLEETYHQSTVPLQKLLSYYPSIGHCDEILHIFIAPDIELCAPNNLFHPTDEELFIKTKYVDFRAIPDQIAAGLYRDGKTLLGLQMAYYEYYLKPF